MEAAPQDTPINGADIGADIGAAMAGHHTPNTPEPEPTPTPEFAVPDAYKDRSWASKYNSQEDFFKAFDNAQSLIGKKSIPDANSSDEEWGEFYSKLRPEDASAYTFSALEGRELSDHEKAELDQYRSTFYEMGLTTQQADKLHAAYVQIEADMRAQWDEQTDALLAETFGEKGVEDAVKTATKYIAGFSPEAKAQLDQANPALMVSITKMMNEFDAKYGHEDDLPNDAGGGAGISKEELLSHITDLRFEARGKYGADRDKIMTKMQELELKYNKLA